MCLLAKKIEGEVSNKPVKCYKVYRKIIGGELESFYKYGGYDLKEGDEITGEGATVIVKDDSVSRTIYQLLGGFIHGWKEQEDCVEMLVAWLSYYTSASETENEYMSQFFETYEGVCICEMEIPAGEKYWVEECDGICAKRMIYRGVLRTVTNDYLKRIIQERCVPLELRRKMLSENA